MNNVQHGRCCRTEASCSHKYPSKTNLKKEQKPMRAIIETVFDIFYLATVLTVGIRMIRGSKSGSQFKPVSYTHLTLPTKA